MKNTYKKHLFVNWKSIAKNICYGLVMALAWLGLIVAVLAAYK